MAIPIRKRGSFFYPSLSDFYEISCGKSWAFVLSVGFEKFIVNV